MLVTGGSLSTTPDGPARLQWIVPTGKYNVMYISYITYDVTSDASTYIIWRGYLLSTSDIGQHNSPHWYDRL